MRVGMALYFELSRDSESIVGHLLSASSERLVDASVAHHREEPWLERAAVCVVAVGGSPQAGKGVLSGLCGGCLAASEAHRESERRCNGL